jgi:hypothetical protein
MEPFHVGRSWNGHPMEDDCPCGKAPCGLVCSDQIDPACTEHAFTAGKSIRQSHPESFCQGPLNARRYMPHISDQLRERGGEIGFQLRNADPEGRRWLLAMVRASRPKRLAPVLPARQIRSRAQVLARTIAWAKDRARAHRGPVVRGEAVRESGPPTGNLPVQN